MICSINNATTEYDNYNRLGYRLAQIEQSEHLKSKLHWASQNGLIELAVIHFRLWQGCVYGNIKDEERRFAVYLCKPIGDEYKMPSRNMFMNNEPATIELRKKVKYYLQHNEFEQIEEE